MAISNEMIILSARLSLLEQGVLQPTGRMLETENDAGERVMVPEPEEIHTFQAWKAAGYSVRRGERAIIRLTIWNHTGRKLETVTATDGSEIETEDRGHYYSKVACFFAAHQVERSA